MLLSFYGFHFFIFLWLLSCVLLLLFEHREVGIVIKNVDVSIGEVTVNLNERLLIKKKRSSESSSGSDRSSVDPMSTKQSSTKQEKLARFSSLFPEKVWNLSITRFSNCHVYFSRLSALVMLFLCELVVMCFSHNLYST